MTAGPARAPRRSLHPGAWWLWALGLAAAATRTTDPVLLLALAAAVVVVVAARREADPGRPGLRGWVVAALAVVAVRVVLRVALDAQHGPTVLFRLPELPLPAAAAGIRLGGPVTLEPALAALYDGLRLAALVVSVGAANVLANPRRLLRSAPAALHEVATALAIALTVAPQLADSAHRVRRARTLRPGPGGRRHVLRQVVVPVLTDALDRSLALAAAMDARGHGRVRSLGRGRRGAGGGLVLGGLVGTAIGAYGLLDAQAPAAVGLPLLVAGLGAAAAGLALGRTRALATRYRPDPWAGPEWAVALSGLAVAAGLVAASVADPANLHPPTQPLVWPSPGALPVLAVLVGFLPAWLPAPRARPPRRPPGGEVAAGTGGDAEGTRPAVGAAP